MAAHKLTVERLHVRWCADAEHERQPMMRMFLSQSVSRSKRDIRLSDAARSANGVVLSNLDLPFAVLSQQDETVHARRMPLSERAKHAYLNVDIWVVMRNHNGESCFNQAGSASIPLHQLLNNSRQEWHLNIPSWGDPNDHGANKDSDIVNDKGTLVFEGVRLVLADGSNVPALNQLEVTTHESVRAQRDKILYSYMLSTVSFFSEHGYLTQSISDINAFVYQGRAGLLPASSYVGTRPGGSGPEFFDRATRIVMARRKIDPATFDWANDTYAASILAQVLTLPSNMMVYVPDAVYFPSSKNRGRFLRRPLESFDSARARGGGDCEDLALEILLCSLELTAVGESGMASYSPIVQGLVNTMKKYHCFMVLGGVSGAEINGEYGVLPEGMGAHMWAALIQKTVVARWFRSGNMTDENFLQRAGVPPAGIPDDARYPKVMILEGTGFLRPEATTSDQEVLRRTEALYYSLFDKVPNKAFAGLRRWFGYKSGHENSFYREASILFTGDFLAVDPDRTHVEFAIGDAKTTRTGVTFQDLIAAGDNVSLWSMPPLNRVESALIRESLYNQAPLEPHIPIKDEQLETPGLISSFRTAKTEFSPVHNADRLQQRRLISRLITEVGGGAISEKNQFIGRVVPYGGDSNATDNRLPDVVPIEMFHKGSLDEDRVERLIQACKVLGIKRVDCTPEALAVDGLSSYCMIFYCPQRDKATMQEIAYDLNKNRDSLLPPPLIKDDYGESEAEHK